MKYYGDEKKPKFRRVRRSVMAIASFFLAFDTVSVTLAQSLFAQVNVVHWKKPTSGWLYVLDSNKGNQPAQVRLIDPKNGTIEGTIYSGYAPDIALSPNGTRLYITSGVTGEGVLTVIDTAKGTIIRTAEVGDRSIYIAIPWVPQVVPSPDGRFVYIMKMRIIKPGQDEHTIATFDTTEGRILPEEAPVPNCGVAHLLPTSVERKLAVHCRETNSLRILQLKPDGGLATQFEVELPSKASPVNHEFAVFSSFFLQGQTMAVIMGDGSALQIDTGKWSRRNISTPALADRWVPFRTWPQSPDGTRIYFGSSSLTDQSSGDVDQIHVLETTTWEQKATVKTSMPFWSLAVSHNGKYLYAISASKQTLLIIDTTNYEEIQAIPGIGEAPALALVAR